MIGDPMDPRRCTAHLRLDRSVASIPVILLAVSGLALFHPAFLPLADLLGGGTWTRILHPYLGVIWALSFAGMVLRVWSLDLKTPAGRERPDRVGETIEGDDGNLPEQGRRDGGRKVLFRGLAVCLGLLTVSGLIGWHAWWTLPATLVRLAAVIHSLAATIACALIIVRIYAAIWTPGRQPSHRVGHRARARHRQLKGNRSAPRSGPAGLGRDPPRLPGSA